MTEPPLTQREFDAWREGDAEFKRRVLDHIEKQHDRNIEVESRLTAVEGGEQRNKRVSVGSVVAAIVTAALTAFTAWGK